MIAEQVENVVPDLVVYSTEGLPHSVAYQDLIVPMMQEIQKLKKRIEHLESQV